MFYDDWYNQVTRQLTEWNEDFTNTDILEREQKLTEFLDKTFQEHYVYTYHEVTDVDKEFARDICQTYIEKIEREPNKYGMDFIYTFFFKKFPEGITIDEIRQHPIIKEAIARHIKEFCYNERHGMTDNLLMIISSDREEFHKLVKIWCKYDKGIMGPAEDIDLQFALLNYCLSYMESVHLVDKVMKYLKNVPWKHIIDLYFTYLGIDERGMEAFNHTENYASLTYICISKFNHCGNDGTFMMLPKYQQQVIITQAFDDDIKWNLGTRNNEDARLQDILSYQSLKLFLAYFTLDCSDNYIWKQKNKLLKAITAIYIIRNRKEKGSKISAGLIKDAGKFYNILKINPDINRNQLVDIIKEDKEVKELFPND